jgi:hypothetical protein
MAESSGESSMMLVSSCCAATNGETDEIYTRPPRVDFGRSNLEQILFSLELKDLVTARSVCRLWAGLIDCKFFRDRFVERWRLVGHAVSRRYLAVISSSLEMEIWNLDKGGAVAKLDLNREYYVKQGGPRVRMSFNYDDSALLVFGLKSSVDGKPMIFTFSGRQFALATYRYPFWI